MPKIACFPIASLKEPRFFDLPPLHQYLFVRMFFCADAWGRLPHSVRGIAQETWQSLELVEEALPNLLSGDRPLIHAYVVDGSGYLQLDQHDARQEQRFLSRRALPMYPDPPPEICAKAGCIDVCRAQRDGNAPRDSEDASQTMDDSGGALRPTLGTDEAPHTDQSKQSVHPSQTPGPRPQTSDDAEGGEVDQDKRNNTNSGRAAKSPSSDRTAIASLIAKVTQ